MPTSDRAQDEGCRLVRNSHGAVCGWAHPRLPALLPTGHSAIHLVRVIGRKTDHGQGAQSSPASRCRSATTLALTVCSTLRVSKLKPAGASTGATGCEVGLSSKSCKEDITTCNLQRDPLTGSSTFRSKRRRIIGLETVKSKGRDHVVTGAKLSRLVQKL